MSTIQKRNWYRSTFYNATILGVCNLLAPGMISHLRRSINREADAVIGIWGAMNSLGAGGEESESFAAT